MWVGRQEVAARYGAWLSGWKDFRADPEQYLVVDPNRILVLVHDSGRGRTSGLVLDDRTVANYFEIRGGKVTRLALYWSRDRALADVGLEE